ncbi:MAG: type II secretion system protein GspJ [bacterium]
MGNDQKGFTLIEMIVATTVLVLVVTSVYSTYRAGMEAWHKGEEAIETLYETKFALDLITNDLRASLLPPLDLSDPSSPKPPKVTFIGRPSEISFATSFNLDKESSPVRVKYFIEEGELKISREEAENLTLATNIAGLSFEYHNGRAWQKSWDSDKLLPGGVRIKIRLNDSRILRSSVWIPASQANGQ